MQFIQNLIDAYLAFLADHAWIAPLATLLFPVVEALIPSLPLTAIVAANLGVLSAAYGPAGGTVLTIVLSAVGSFAAMFGIFLVIRSVWGERFAVKVEASPFGRRFVNIAAGGNTAMILALMSNPFLPSSIMNYVLAFTKVKVGRYLFLTGVSRIVIIVFIVFLGSLFNIQEHPLNVLWLMLAYALLFFLGWIVKRVRERRTA
ncbi:MAG: hypothetical protein WC509_00780 [Candidatus Izemoplasmatales bacterium]